MSEKIASFLDVSAAFGEAFLRRFGRGILDGTYMGGKMTMQFAVAALAVWYATQVLEAEKACDALSSASDQVQVHKSVGKPAGQIPSVSDAVVGNGGEQ